MVEISVRSVKRFKSYFKASCMLKPTFRMMLLCGYRIVQKSSCFNTFIILTVVYSEIVVYVIDSHEKL